MTVKRRAGFSLVEVMVAALLVAGPMLVILTLGQSSRTAAAQAAEVTTARLVLLDLMELLMGEPLDELRRTRDAASASDDLETLLGRRLAELPPAVRESYRRQIMPLIGKVTLALDENVGGKAGLARITLSVPLGKRGPVKVSRLFRPAPPAQPPA
jgi:type II secretory pathway component PulJ